MPVVLKADANISTGGGAGGGKGGAGGGAGAGGGGCDGAGDCCCGGGGSADDGGNRGEGGGNGQGGRGGAGMRNGVDGRGCACSPIDDAGGLMVGGGGSCDGGGIGRCPTSILCRTEAASRPVSPSALSRTMLAPVSKRARPAVHVNAAPMTSLPSWRSGKARPARTSPWLSWLSWLASSPSSLSSACRWRPCLDMRPIRLTGLGSGSSPSPSLQPPSMLTSLSRTTRAMPLSEDRQDLWSTGAVGSGSSSRVHSVASLARPRTAGIGRQNLPLQTDRQTDRYMEKRSTHL